MTAGQQALVQRARRELADQTLLGEDRTVVQYLVRRLEDPAAEDDRAYYAQTLRQRMDHPNRMVLA